MKKKLLFVRQEYDSLTTIPGEGPLERERGSSCDELELMTHGSLRGTPYTLPTRGTDLEVGSHETDGREDLI